MHLTPPGPLVAKSKAAEDCTHSKTLARSRKGTVGPTGFGVRAVLCRFPPGEGGVKCIVLICFYLIGCRIYSWLWVEEFKDRRNDCLGRFFHEPMARSRDDLAFDIGCYQLGLFNKRAATGLLTG